MNRTELSIEATRIPGLLTLQLPVHSDSRGWFKENWQREKMVALGLPDFGPVQNNISYNEAAGTTRGLHAEPWDKFVSVARGSIFGAWVDLRDGESFGRVVTLEMGPDTAVLVPRGVGNGFQTLQDGTAYVYLVNDHWSKEAQESYRFVNADDPALGIAWPLPLDQARLSDADRAHPHLSQVDPFPPPRTLIIGGSGQIGKALAHVFPKADAVDRPTLDLTDAEAMEAYPWGEYDTIINAAAYTAVDDAETPTGRRAAWESNVSAVQRLVDSARRHRAVLVHYSSDYVFDGSEPVHTESELFTPLGVYGQTKAAGDSVVSTWQRHYILRTSWVVGDGANFVRTMARLADTGVSPTVINDQLGRLSFAEDIARATQHLLQTGAAYGTYNVTSSGDEGSWADIAESVFRARGRSPADVTPVTTEEYADGKALAPRPRHSALDLAKIEQTGFTPPDGWRKLTDYLAEL